MFPTKVFTLSLEDIFNSISNDDLAGCVMSCLQSIRKQYIVLPLPRTEKSEFTSNSYRKEGNVEYKKGRFHQALISYNKALCYAPKGSLAMKLAYSNRSALFFTTKHIHACLKDIATCLSMGCPPKLVDKLEKRKSEALYNLWMDHLEETFSPIIYANEIFKLKTQNPNIPNVSGDIEIIMQSDGPKIVASRDISLGTVLVLETAFASELNMGNANFSCYYCLKMSLNLMPCDGCCQALFCNASCMESSMDEGHSVLCEIIDALVGKDPMAIIATKATVKMRQKFESWEEWIMATINIDGSIPRKSISDIFDKNLLLVNNENDHFIVGRMFALSYELGIIVHFLDKMTNFFPEDHETRKRVIYATARIMMCISLNAVCTAIPIPIMICQDITTYSRLTNLNCYQFIGVMRKSCIPNTVPICLNRDIALMSITPIKKGTELTVSHLPRWFEENQDLRAKRVNFIEHRICTCVFCSGNYKHTRHTLTDDQKKAFNHFNDHNMGVSPQEVTLAYRLSCKTLEKLSDVPFSNEYAKVFNVFNKCILYYINAKAGNWRLTQTM